MCYLDLKKIVMNISPISSLRVACSRMKLFYECSFVPGWHRVFTRMCIIYSTFLTVMPLHVNVACRIITFNCLSLVKVMYQQNIPLMYVLEFF